MPSPSKVIKVLSLLITLSFFTMIVGCKTLNGITNIPTFILCWTALAFFLPFSVKVCPSNFCQVKVSFLAKAIPVNTWALPSLLFFLMSCQCNNNEPWTQVLANFLKYFELYSLDFKPTASKITLVIFVNEWLSVLLSSFFKTCK